MQNTIVIEAGRNRIDTTGEISGVIVSYSGC